MGVHEPRAALAGHLVRQEEQGGQEVTCGMQRSDPRERHSIGAPRLVPRSTF